MKRSNKLSLVSLAALSLPITAAGVAAAQQADGAKAQPVASASRSVGSGAISAEEIDVAFSSSESVTDAYTQGWDVGHRYDQMLFVASEPIDDNTNSEDGPEPAPAPTPTAATEADAAEPAEAAAETPVGHNESDMDAYAAYWAEGYNYAQLLVLADEWNVSEFEAKGRAGRAILAGDTSSFDPLVEGVAPLPMETEYVDGGEAAVDYPDSPFWDAGYVYDDAVVLAAEWNIDTYSAKTRAADLIKAGNQAEVEAILDQS